MFCSSKARGNEIRIFSHYTSILYCSLDFVSLLRKVSGKYSMVDFFCRREMYVHRHRRRVRQPPPIHQQFVPGHMTHCPQPPSHHQGR